MSIPVSPANLSQKAKSRAVDATPSPGDPRHAYVHEEEANQELVTSEEYSLDISIQDASNPNSVYSLSPPWFQPLIEQVDPSLLQKDPDELREEAKPSSLVNKFRLALWMEYDKALSLGRTMNLGRVYQGLCTKQFFLGVCDQPLLLAWILTPVDNYKQAMVEGLEYGLSQVRRMLALPLKTGEGEVDHKACNVILRAYKMLDDRVNGPTSGKGRRPEEEELLPAPASSPGETQTPAEIEAEMAKLEEEIAKNEKLVHIEE